MFYGIETIEAEKEGMVGPCGLEPQTSTVSRWRSSQLSYGPIVAESISWAIRILPHFGLGAQFWFTTGGDFRCRNLV